MGKKKPAAQSKTKLEPSRRQGLPKALFDLEADIMDAIWGSHDPVLVRGIHSALSRRRSIAYTTVMTTMDRLWKKGVLERESQGKAYAYWPRMTRAEFYRQVAAQVIDSLLPQATEPLLAFFVETTAHSDPAHLDRLEELIRTKREELERERGGES